jgi:polysaccharide deacetylase family protein (PEP-CTERM system associated)
MTAARGLAAPAATPRPPFNAFTVDVEEWFHICGIEALAPQHWDGLPARVTSTTTWLLDRLDRLGITGTFFVVGWIAERYPELIRQIAAAGHEIGSHSYWHRRVYELDRQVFVDDVAASCRALEAAGVGTVQAFRAPEWSINDRSLWALDELARLGFTIDASMAPLKIVGSVEFPRAPHRRATAHGPIVELPPLVADRFGQVMPLGWGWGLRMSSPRRVLRTIGTLNDAGQSTVLTIHPWELDPDPPRVTLPRGLRFAHYFRLRGFRERLMAILAGARFGPISSLVPAATAQH